MSYQPFVVVLRDGAAGRIVRPRSRRYSSRARPATPRGTRSGRGTGRAAERGSGRARSPRRIREEFAPIEVEGSRAGTVAVPSVPPPVFIGLWELAPTLTWVGVTLLAIGAGATALLVFRPTHKRLRTLEEAARALGEGRTDVRASETGGDEVTALARTFNRMAGDLQSRASALSASDRARRQLLADVSHELMTPLSAIRGYVETLSMPELTLDEATRRRYLDIVARGDPQARGDHRRPAGPRAARRRSGYVEADGGQRQRSVCPHRRPSWSGHGGTRHPLARPSCADRALTVWGDASRLEQALQNVAANAIRHTPEGGRIVLRGERLDDRVRITVTDSGPGFRWNICRTSSIGSTRRTRRARGRRFRREAGLGLSIVQAIVARHHGEVSASNVEDGGAQVELTLPKGGAPVLCRKREPSSVRTRQGQFPTAQAVPWELTRLETRTCGPSSKKSRPRSIPRRSRGSRSALSVSPSRTVTDVE